MASNFDYFPATPPFGGMNRDLPASGLGAQQFRTVTNMLNKATTNGQELVQKPRVLLFATLSAESASNPSELDDCENYYYYYTSSC